MNYGAAGLLRQQQQQRRSWRSTSGDGAAAAGFGAVHTHQSKKGCQYCELDKVGMLFQYQFRSASNQQL
jgi:hypothetical protein